MVLHMDSVDLFAKTVKTVSTTREMAPLVRKWQRQGLSAKEMWELHKADRTGRHIQAPGSDQETQPPADPAGRDRTAVRSPPACAPDGPIAYVLAPLTACLPSCLSVCSPHICLLVHPLPGKL